MRNLQTDLDAKTSYSMIRKLTLRTVPFNVNIYPNPIDGDEFTTEAPFEDTFVVIEVFNAAGQVVFSGKSEGPPQSGTLETSHEVFTL